MPNDITYCVNADCPFKDCDRHLRRVKKKKGTISVASFDGVCEKYIEYLVEVVNSEE